MIISPISFVNSHNNIQFKGNTMPEAVSKATKEVLRELDINTGTSYVAKLLREPQNAQLVESWNNIWKTLKDNIPFADTVEKLELLKTYGISLLRYTEDEMAKFLTFLKSNPSDKDVFFLQTAIDVARRGEIARIKNGKSHFIFDDFEPVLNHVLSENKNERINLTSSSKSEIDSHYDRMFNVLRSDIHTTKKDADNIISAINKLLSNKISPRAYGGYKYDSYGLTSIKAEHDNKYIEIRAIKNEAGNPEIIVGYSNKEYTSTPVDRQIYILLDNYNKLLKLKLLSYLRRKDTYYPYIDKELSDSENLKYYREEIKNYLSVFHIDLESYESPFIDENRLPRGIANGVIYGKYMLKIVDYNPETKIAKLSDYAGSSIIHPQKYRLVDKYSDKLGIMVDENNPISFMPIEPTNYDLEQMINNEKTNNLLKVLNLSGFNDCFMRIIEVLSN